MQKSKSLQYVSSSEPLHISIKQLFVVSVLVVPGTAEAPGTVPGIENSLFTEMCSDSEKGSFFRLIDSCITQLQAWE